MWMAMTLESLMENGKYNVINKLHIDYPKQTDSNHRLHNFRWWFDKNTVAKRSNYGQDRANWLQRVKYN